MKHLLLLTLMIITAAVASAAPLTPQRAWQAYQDKTLPAFLKETEDSLRLELSAKKFNDDAIVNAAALRAFASRFAAAKLETPADSATLEWALKHPVIGPLLFTALSPRDNPPRVISVLTALRTSFAQAVEQYPELAVAISLVWDSPAREEQSPAQAIQSACDIFAHLTQNRAVLRFDPQSLPWPVLIYLVDSRVTTDERRWAIKTYRLPAEPGRAYFDIRYDIAGFYSGAWRGGQRQPYTLPNILKLGGVCKDQAHFTAEVSRAYGIPATLCTGQSGGGEGFHAWVGLLKTVKKRIEWDFQTARYPDHGFWSGTVIDPQTGQKFADSEVAMSAQWCNVTAAKRLFSLAATQSLDLLETAPRINAAKEALEACPGNLAAWNALVKECIAPDAPPGLLKEVSAVIERFAVGRYDDFAFKSFTTLVSSLKPDQQLATLDKMTTLFPQRPDLLAEIAMRKGDAQKAGGKPVDALRSYQRVLDQSLRFGPIALDAIARVDAMLRPAGKIPQLLEQYRQAWTRMPKPEASGYITTTPWYIMGERYAKMLEESNDKTTAANVRQTITARDLSKH